MMSTFQEKTDSLRSTMGVSDDLSPEQRLVVNRIRTQVAMGMFPADRVDLQAWSDLRSNIVQDLVLHAGDDDGRLVEDFIEVFDAEEIRVTPLGSVIHRDGLESWRQWIPELAQEIKRIDRKNNTAVVGGEDDDAGTLSVSTGIPAPVAQTSEAFVTLPVVSNVSGDGAERVIRRAALGQYPEVAAVFTDTLIGSSTRIGDRVMLTAAHVLEKSNHKNVGLRVGFGPTTGHGMRDADERSVIDYQLDVETDLALLKLSSAPDFLSSMIQIASAEEAASAMSIADDGAPHAFIVGYGSNVPAGNEGAGTRRWAEVAYGQDPAGSDQLKLVGLADLDYRTICMGDSGGPMLVQAGDRRKLHGVNSASSYVALASPCGTAGLFTRLDLHFDWLRGAFDALGEPRPAILA